MAATVLAVSPHLDDAALSAGATLAELALRGTNVHVLTLFSAVPPGHLSPVAAAFHRDCGLPPDQSAEAIRVREDVAAVEALGATPHHAGFYDAVYRRREDGRWLCERDRSMFDAPSDEPSLHRQVGDAVERLARDVRPELVLTCAGVGGHIDHAMTRTAVVEVADRAASFGLRLWEDLPYAVGRDAHGWSSPPVSVRPEAWARKWEAVARYESQTRMLWPGTIGGEKILEAHARDRGEGTPAELWREHHQAPAEQWKDRAR